MKRTVFRIKHRIAVSWLLALVLCMMQVGPAAMSTAKAAPATSGPDPNFHIYLAFGQSNMTGASPIEEQDRICDEDYLVMCTSNYFQSPYNPETRILGNWYKAVPPLSDDTFGQLGVADYFGRRMLALKKEENPNVRVGIIVVAIPGVGIRTFDKDLSKDYIQSMPPAARDFVLNFITRYDNDPYQRLISCGRKAQQYGVIKGIILHQGENDYGTPGWCDVVEKIYGDITTDLNLPEGTPFVAGEVRRGSGCEGSNEFINELPLRGDAFSVVSSADLAETDEAPGDVHFTSAEYRVMGSRYADVMLEAEKKASEKQASETVSENHAAIGKDEGSGEGNKQAKPASDPKDPGADQQKEAVIEKGMTFTDDDETAVCRVEEIGEKPAVTYIRPCDRSAKKIRIPSKVRIKGKEFTVTGIGKKAFSGCSALTQITIPQQVTHFEAELFAKAGALRSIRFLSRKLKKGYFHKKTFRGLKTSAVVRVHKTKVKAYGKLFQKKGLSKSVKVRKG